MVIKGYDVSPQFNSLAEFIAMGKHGIYVWSSWGITLVVIVGLVLYSIKQRQQVCNEIMQQHARQQQRKR